MEVVVQLLCASNDLSLYNVEISAEPELIKTYRSHLSSDVLGWAGPLWAWAYGDAEPSPVGGLGLGWAWLGLGPGLGL